MEYEEFELELRGLGGKKYEALLHKSPAGPAQHTFNLPYEEETLKDFFSAILERTDVRHIGRADFIKDFGGPLFDNVFAGQILLRWRQSYKNLKPNQGLSVRLRMNYTAELQKYPWEYLYDQDERKFISAIRNVSVVRSLDVVETKAAPLSGPLRVLVIAAIPTDLPQIDVEREWNVIKNSLDPLVSTGSVTLKLLSKSTLSALNEELEHPYHVLHFIGHGEVDSAMAYLTFESDSGGADPVPADKLGNVIAGRPSLRVVVLNSCQGGRLSGASPLSGVAQNLIHSGVAAVIAMLSKISDKSAVVFARAFYEALAKGVTIDEAVAMARRSMFTDSAGGGSEWGTPALFVGGRNGSIFRLVRQETPYVWSKTIGESVDDIFEAGSDLVVRSASRLLVMQHDSDELLSCKIKSDRTPFICAASLDLETSRIWLVSSDDPLAPSTIRAKRIDYPSGEEIFVRPSLPQMPLAIRCWPTQQSLFIVFASGYSRIEELRGPLLSVTKWNYEAAAATFNRDFLVTTSSSDQQLRIYSLDLQEKQRLLTKTAEVHLMALAETKGIVCLADQNHILTILNLDDASHKREISQRNWITAVALNQDGSYLAFATADPGRSIFVCNLKTRSSSAQCIGRSDSLIMCLTFSLQKLRLYSGSATGEVRAWSLDVELN